MAALIQRRPQHRDVGGGVRQHVLDRLLLGDGLAELDAVLGVLGRDGEQLLHRAEAARRQRQPAEIEDAHGGREALSDLTDDVRRRGPRSLRRPAPPA